MKPIKKEYAIEVDFLIEKVEVIDPSDSCLILIPAPFVGITTLGFEMTSSGEVHVRCNGSFFIFTRRVVLREEFINESLIKLANQFGLKEQLDQLEWAFNDFIEYTNSLKGK